MDGDVIKEYQPLGNKTLFMMILAESFVLLTMILVLIVVTVLLNYVNLPQKYAGIVAEIISLYEMVLLIVFGATLFMGWLRYYRYGIFLYEKSFKITSGFISIKETGIPYRRIQDITIERSLVDQLLGMSNIVITVLGLDEREAVGSDESDRVILPSLNREIASEIQDTILRRAQVEQINVLDHVTVKPHQDSQ